MRQKVELQAGKPSVSWKEVSPFRYNTYQLHPQRPPVEGWWVLHQQRCKLSFGFHSDDACWDLGRGRERKQMVKMRLDWGRVQLSAIPYTVPILLFCIAYMPEALSLRSRSVICNNQSSLYLGYSQSSGAHVICCLLSFHLSSTFMALSKLPFFKDREYRTYKVTSLFLVLIVLSKSLHNEDSISSEIKLLRVFWMGLSICSRRYFLLAPFFLIDAGLYSLTMLIAPKNASRLIPPISAISLLNNFAIRI